MKKLFYMPILHSEADLGSLAGNVASKGIKLVGEEKWKMHLKTINLFWNSVEDYFNELKVTRFKIFQDSLFADGKTGEKIVNESAVRGSRNYAIIKKLLEKNAELVKTEDLSLLKKEVGYITKLAKSKNLIEKLTAYLKYKLKKGKLLKQRDEFIAETISKSLKEGETGILFIGAFHNIMPELAKDIKVIELKEREKIERYQKIYYLKTKEKEMQELSEYLAMPINERDLK